MSLLLVILTLVPCRLHGVSSLTSNVSVNVSLSAQETLRVFHDHNSRLYIHLMNDYHKQLSPYYTNSAADARFLPEGAEHPGPMLTTTTLSYVRIIKVDQMEQVMKVIAELRTIWRDYRLTWNPAEFGGIEHVYMSRANVWVPELNVADCENSIDVTPEHKQNVLLNFTGHVLHYTSLVAHSVCPLQTHDFPFDEQTCSLCLIENLFNKNESAIDISIAPRISLQRAGNGEWEVTGMNVSQRTIQDYLNVEFDYMCFDFKLQRKANFYVMVIIVPTFIITTLSITGVFSKRLTGEDFLGELSLGLTSLMTLTVMLGIVADSLPKTNTLPVLSIFLTIDVTLTALSVLVVILHPRIFYPKIQAIRSRLNLAALAALPENAASVTMENEVEGRPKSWVATLIRRQRRTAKSFTANIVFMLVFQAINLANLYYILSFWWS